MCIYTVRCLYFVVFIFIQRHLKTTCWSFRSAVSLLWKHFHCMNLTEARSYIHVSVSLELLMAASVKIRARIACKLVSLSFYYFIPAWVEEVGDCYTVKLCVTWQQHLFYIRIGVSIIHGSEEIEDNKGVQREEKEKENVLDCSKWRKVSDFVISASVFVFNDMFCCLRCSQ